MLKSSSRCINNVFLIRKDKIMRVSVYRRLQEQRIIELSRLAVSAGSLVILSLIFIISFGCALAKFN